MIVEVVIRLTSFGFNFMTALDLLEKTLISIDWDEFKRPSDNPDPRQLAAKGLPGEFRA